MFMELTTADGTRITFNTDNIECVYRAADETASIRLVSGETIGVREKYETIRNRLLSLSTKKG